MADVALRSSWLATWTRAVVVPASRRALAIWVGAGLVASVIFGGNGMQPRDLTGLAWHVPAVGAVLAVTWILVFLPTARVLVRADGATYLRALPAPRVLPLAIATLALIALQWPWLVLWIAGDGVRGLAIVAATSVVIAVIAAWRPARRHARWPAWRTETAALRGMYLRAIGRRAGDAVMRGAGLAVLAGVAAGLLVRNNDLVGRDAAVLGTAVIEIALVPAAIGVLLPLLEAHRASRWLAESLGIAPRVRLAVLASMVIAVYTIAAAIAAGAVAIVLGGSLSTIAWITGMSVAVAICAGLLQTRMLMWAEPSPQAAARVVSGAAVVTAISIAWLGALGVTGVLALAATSVVAIATVRA